jgi:hypothetical protein
VSNFILDYPPEKEYNLAVVLKGIASQERVTNIGGGKRDQARCPWAKEVNNLTR